MAKTMDEKQPLLKNENSTQIDIESAGKMSKQITLFEPNSKLMLRVGIISPWDKDISVTFRDPMKSQKSQYRSNYQMDAKRENMWLLM